MAIDDDPIDIVTRELEQDFDSESRWPPRIIRVCLSVLPAILLVDHPALASITSSITSITVSNIPDWLLKRFLIFTRTFQRELKRIENKIPDMAFYNSEEFESYVRLLAERIDTTYDHRKLKMFGEALAHSGSSDFQSDPREDFIRMLRDLSLGDLQELKIYASLPARYLDSAKRIKIRNSQTGLKGERLSRATRLIGLGLLEEELSVKAPIGHFGASPKEAIRIVATMLETPPVRSYKLSDFGMKFLQFISGDETSA